MYRDPRCVDVRARSLSLSVLSGPLSLPLSPSVSLPSQTVSYKTIRHSLTKALRKYIQYVFLHIHTCACKYTCMNAGLCFCASVCVCVCVCVSVRVSVSVCVYVEQQVLVWQRRETRVRLLSPCNQSRHAPSLHLHFQRKGAPWLALESVIRPYCLW